MHVWQAVPATLNAIENHISSAISIEELVPLASPQPFCDHHLFTHLVKKPTREYIGAWQHTGACNMLRDQENRVDERETEV